MAMLSPKGSAIAEFSLVFSHSKLGVSWDKGGRIGSCSVDNNSAFNDKVWVVTGKTI